MYIQTDKSKIFWKIYPDESKYKMDLDDSKFYKKSPNDVEEH